MAKHEREQDPTILKNRAHRRNAALPAYHRLYVMLSEHIRDGQYLAGSLLPSEKVLTEKYKLSRVTVRRALDQLVEDGLVEKHKGQGTIVMFNDETDVGAQDKAGGLIANLVAQGVQFTTKTLVWDLVAPNNIVQQKLNLMARQECYLIRRLRYLNGSPMSYTSIYLPEHIGDLLDNKHEENRLILELLDDTPHQSEHMNFVMSATLAHGEVAELLELPEGAPLLRMRGVVCDKQDKSIYFQESIYHPERYEYEVDLMRDRSSGKIFWTQKT